jgi:transcriptional regulator with XRE-family HTH domain
MMSHLGDFFRARRVEQGLSLGQLARILGYRNVTRGSNRIKTFEAGGKVAPELLAKLASALAIGDDEVRRLAAEDYREWLRWADEPVRPYLVIRHLACVYERVALPDDALDPATAEAFAARLARERKRRVCLVLSRRLSVGFDVTGRMGSRLEATPDVPCAPYAVIGGRRCQFDFRGGVVLRPIDEPR